MEFSHSRAIITGGASGLGLAVAEQLIAAGGRVAILDKDETQGAKAAQTLGKGAYFIATDVSSESAVDRAVARAAALMEGLTLAVNCAGIAPSQRVLGRDGLMSGAEFGRVMAINLMGTFLVCRAAAGLMQHNTPTGADGERGVLINTASIAAFEGQIGQAAYAASKGGVASMCLPLAREFARLGIRVNTIAPGLFATPMFAGLPPQARATLAAGTPFPPRPGRPAEFAALVRHIVENPMINGTLIRLDGALRMTPQ